MSTIANNECTGQTIVDRIKFWGKTAPSTPAFIFWGPAGRCVLSRADVLDLSSRFAYRLTQLGVGPKDVISITLPNSPARAVVEFGVQLAGAVSMNGQVVRADGQDFISALNRGKCKFAVLDPNLSSGPWPIIQKASDTCDMYDDHAEYHGQTIPLLQKTVFCRTSDKENSFMLKLSKYERYIYEDGKSYDLAKIFTTSGSTGYSKLVCLTNEGVLMFGFTFSHMLNLHKEDIFLNAAPFGWAGGYPSAYLFSGCTRIAFDESAGVIPNLSHMICDAINKEKASVASMLPSVLAAVLDQRSMLSYPENQHKLQKLITGGQPIKKVLIESTDVLTHSIGIAYGSTEIGLVCNIDINADKEYQDLMAGYPLSGVAVKIVDGKLEPVNDHTTSRGEILIQSPNLCAGIIEGDESSHDSFLPDGWFRTGDIGFLKDDGCLFVEGRSSDAIMHGAYILYPTWLEQILIKCSGVNDVVIVPVPDKILHHEICACVKLDRESEIQPSAEEIISFCEREILLHKSSGLNVVPKFVLFFEEYPQTKSGKIDRKRLTFMAENHLNL